MNDYPAGREGIVWNVVDRKNAKVLTTA